MTISTTRLKQRDFYALAAFFADVQQWGVYADYGYTDPALKGYNNDSPFPPEIVVENAYLKARIARQKAAELRLAAAKADTCFTAWQQGISAFLTNHPDGWETPAPDVKTSVVKAKPEESTPTPAVLSPNQMGGLKSPRPPRRIWKSR